MSSPVDPTKAIRSQAESFPGVSSGTSCNQTAFKVGKTAFLYIGPGPKGQGFKAMFKLIDSQTHAVELASSDPEAFQVGSNHWVTARFTTENPLPSELWEKWLTESYQLSC